MGRTQTADTNNPQITTLYRVEAPTFVAGFEVDDEGQVTASAPILKRWVAGKTLASASAYFRRRGWKVERCGFKTDGAGRLMPQT